MKLTLLHVLGIVMEGENSKNNSLVKLSYRSRKIYDLNITKPDIVLSTSMIYTKPKQD